MDVYKAHTFTCVERPSSECAYECWKYELVDMIVRACVPPSISLSLCLCVCVSVFVYDCETIFNVLNVGNKWKAESIYVAHTHSECIPFVFFFIRWIEQGKFYECMTTFWNLIISFHRYGNECWFRFLCKHTDRIAVFCRRMGERRKNKWSEKRLHISAFGPFSSLSRCVRVWMTSCRMECVLMNKNKISEIQVAVLVCISHFIFGSFFGAENRKFVVFFF